MGSSTSLLLIGSQFICLCGVHTSEQSRQSTPVPTSFLFLFLSSAAVLVTVSAQNNIAHTSRNGYRCSLKNPNHWQLCHCLDTRQNAAHIDRSGQRCSCGCCSFTQVKQKQFPQGIKEVVFLSIAIVAGLQSQFQLPSFTNWILTFRQPHRAA